MNRTFNNNESKPKSIIVNGDLHYHFKVHCKGKSMKIGGVIEDLMKLYLTNNKNLQGMIDEMKESESKRILVESHK